MKTEAFNSALVAACHDVLADPERVVEQVEHTGDDIFFFSSRRRHTRCGRDWSSDVCSSDLRWVCGCTVANAWATRSPCWNRQAPQTHRRSEERRVGKECRSRWSTCH